MTCLTIPGIFLFLLFLGVSPLRVTVSDTMSMTLPRSLPHHSPSLPITPYHCPSLLLLLSSSSTPVRPILLFTHILSPCPTPLLPPRPAVSEDHGEDTDEEEGSGQGRAVPLQPPGLPAGQQVRPTHRPSPSFPLPSLSFLFLLLLFSYSLPSSLLPSSLSSPSRHLLFALFLPPSLRSSSFSPSLSPCLSAVTRTSTT